MIEFLYLHGSDIILGLIILAFLLTFWVARKIVRGSSRKPCSEKARRTKNQEITQSLHLKMKRIEKNGHPRFIKKPSGISLEVLDVDLEKVDLEATISSYWKAQA